MTEYGDQCLEMRAHLNPLFEPDERILWVGRPAKASGLDDPDLGGKLIIVWVVPVVALALITNRLNESVPDHQATAVVEGILKAIILIGMVTFLIGTGVRSLLRRPEDSPVPTSYRLTNKRAIVMEGESGEYVRSVKLNTLEAVRTEVRSNGTGTIHCKSRDLERWGRDWTGIPLERPLFRNIREPVRVHSLIESAAGPLPGPGTYEIEHTWEKKLRDRANTGEVLIWAEKPQQHFMIDRKKIRPSLLALPFFIVPVYFIREALQSRDKRNEGIGAASDAELNLMVVVAAVAFGIGLYLLVLRFFVNTLWRNYTSYGLTGSQAIVSSPGSVHLFPLAGMSDLRIAPQPEGLGTILCRCEDTEQRIVIGGFRRSLHRSHDGPLFRGISDPEGVKALLFEAVSHRGESK